jgi:endonuclease YncB( thermonuclease family)
MANWVRSLVAATVAMAPFPVLALEITCVPRVVVGDTLNVEGLCVRLHGIDAPETAKTCNGARARDYASGEQASQCLRVLADGRSVTCDGNEFDRYKRFEAVCRVDTIDINRALVAEGLAWAFVRFSDDDLPVEREARAARRAAFASANMLQRDR